MAQHAVCDQADGVWSAVLPSGSDAWVLSAQNWLCGIGCCLSCPSDSAQGQVLPPDVVKGQSGRNSIQKATVEAICTSHWLSVWQTFGDTLQRKLIDELGDHQHEFVPQWLDVHVVCDKCGRIKSGTSLGLLSLPSGVFGWQVHSRGLSVLQLRTGRIHTFEKIGESLKCQAVKTSRIEMVVPNENVGHAWSGDDIKQFPMRFDITVVPSSVDAPQNFGLTVLN